jgi:hypothetical protein
MHESISLKGTIDYITIMSNSSTKRRQRPLDSQGHVCLSSEKSEDKYLDKGAFRIPKQQFTQNERTRDESTFHNSHLILNSSQATDNHNKENVYPKRNNLPIGSACLASFSKESSYKTDVCISNIDMECSRLALDDCCTFHFHSDSKVVTGEVEKEEPGDEADDKSEEEIEIVRICSREIHHLHARDDDQEHKRTKAELPYASGRYCIPFDNCATVMPEPECLPLRTFTYVLLQEENKVYRPRPVFPVSQKHMPVMAQSQSQSLSLENNHHNCSGNSNISSNFNCNSSNDRKQIQSYNRSAFQDSTM